MTSVEHFHPGTQWAEPLTGKDFDVVQADDSLQIIGGIPTYQKPKSPSDLLVQYEEAPEITFGEGRTGMQSPDVRFANANTDAKLIAFVKRFGPVVANDVVDTRMFPNKETGTPEIPGRYRAEQYMNELRNEQVLYRAAFGLIVELNKKFFDIALIQNLMRTIAENVKDWPRQREREKQRREPWGEPLWDISDKAITAIEEAAFARYEPWAPELPGRIILCELLNSFRQTAFPNLASLHREIKYGIRPLLYSLLRRRAFYPRGSTACENTECRNFFDVERAGQQYCSEKCSRQHRQRIYWAVRGKPLRKRRVAKLKKLAKLKNFPPAK